MTEDELLLGLTQAAELGGWRWTHARRSDAAQLMGDPGVPDLIAVSGPRRQLLAWELKSDRGAPTYEQLAWLRELAWVRHVDARIVRPADYDDALRVLLNTPDPGLTCVVCGSRDVTRVLDARVKAGLCVRCDPA